MSAAAAPWSVKGIDPKAREIAKDLARRSGMTLGEWLNSMIMDEPEDDDQVATLPRRSAIPDPYDRRARSRRLDDAYSGPSLEVIAERLEAAERRSADAIRSIEDAVSGLVRRLDRQEGEQSSLERRVDRATDELRDGYHRLKKLEQSDPSTEETARLATVTERLDQAQNQTKAALKALEASFATLDNRLLQAETKAAPDEGREASRFERLAETLSRQVEGNRIEMMRRLDVVEIESRADRLERAIHNVTEQSRAAEKKSVAAVEAMGREVMRIAQNLNTRVERVEEGGLLEQLGEKLERDLARHTQSVDLRLTRADENHARAIERLGDEITRISDRLSDRIAASERRSAEAVDDISRRMAEHSERLEARNQMQGDLAERIRQSEERTAQLLAEARDSMDQRAQKAAAMEPSLPTVADPDLGGIPAWSAAEAPASDWRAAAFGDASLWSEDDLDGLLDAAPFPAPREAAQPEPAEAVVEPRDEVNVFPDEIEAELTAWVEARSLEAEAASPFGSSAERADFGSLSQPLTADYDDAPLVFKSLSDADPALDADLVAADKTMAAFDEALLFEARLQDQDAAPQDDILSAYLDPTSDLPASQEASPDLGYESAMEAPEPDADDAWLDAPLSDTAQAESLPAETTEDPPFLAEASATEDAPSTETEAPSSSDVPSSVTVESILSTRAALGAARAAMSEPVEDEGRGTFGLKRKGGKSKLQEKLDKKASGDVSGLRKLFGASLLAALVVGGGYGFLELSDAAHTLPVKRSSTATPDGGTALAAVSLATTPTDATPSTDIAASEGGALFERAVDLLDRGDDSGVEALRRAADLGHPGAQLRLAGLYEVGGSGVEADLKESRNWARRAAEGGDAQAMHYYAMQLYEGTGGAQNRVAALGWLKRAAEAGRVDSQYNVARLYEIGDEGVTKNPVEAFKWYMIAARRGDQQALSAVQRLTPITDAEARRKAREAADAFHVDPLA